MPSDAFHRKRHPLDRANVVLLNIYIYHTAYSDQSTAGAAAVSKLARFKHRLDRNAADSSHSKMFSSWMVSLCSAVQVLTVVKGSTPMTTFLQSTHENPALLFECYHNATNSDTQNYENIAVLFDGTQKEPDDVEITIYSTDANGKINRTHVNLTYDSKTDTMINPAEGFDVSITVLQVYKHNVQYTSERDGAEYIGKVYDIDVRCLTAKELYAELCESECDLVPAREL